MAGRKKSAKQAGNKLRQRARADIEAAKAAPRIDPDRLGDEVKSGESCLVVQEGRST